MSFDRLAAHYRWMEWLLAGGKLQRCRTTFLRRIPIPREVLLLGEGNGRFLEALLRVHPRARVTCVDESVAMLDRARTRLSAEGVDASAVTFVHADILRWSPPRRKFDLVVSNFFLDCFRSLEIARIVASVAPSATDDAHWLFADFREPASGFAKWRARLILRAMYFFFRRATKLSGSRIFPPEHFFPAHGFQLRERTLTEWGLLHSDWWTREVVRPLEGI